MKAIVLYYSYGGNTRKIAAKIQKALTCDAAEIKPQTPYVGNYNAVVEPGAARNKQRLYAKASAIGYGSFTV